MVNSSNLLIGRAHRNNPVCNEPLTPCTKQAVLYGFSTKNRIISLKIFKTVEKKSVFLSGKKTANT